MIAVPRSLPIVLLGLVLACADPGGEPVETGIPVRVATFNVEILSREKVDQVDERGRGRNPQLLKAAEIVQRVRPDVLLLNEIDFDGGATPRLFVERYLQVDRDGQSGVDYPHVYCEASNTGVLSGFDLDDDGKTDSPEDGWGFGHYPGQYAMALLSRFPIDAEAARTFHLLRWQAMPGNLMPDGQDGKPAWFDPEEAAALRLSSKSHWDVPVRIGGVVVHVLASHPTPPVFDGDEDRNGRRNFDEIRLWADYLSDAAGYLVDDRGGRGGLPAGASFVLLGDFNADPYNDRAPYGTTAIGQLLDHPRVRDPLPRAPGGAEVEREYAGPADTRTSSWGRLDYVLPSHDLEVRDSGVFWPASDDPLDRLVSGDEAASDHHLVWVDLVVPNGI